MSAAPAHDDSLWEKFYRAPLLRREYGQLPESGVFTYTTAHGDTLSSIAEKFYADARRGRAIASWNGLEPHARLHSGKDVKLVIPRLALMATLEVMKKSDQGCSLEPAASDRRFKRDEQFRLRVSANASGWLYTFNRDAEGRWKRLHPILASGGEVLRFTDYVLPNDAGATTSWFRLDHDKGAEELVLIFAVEPVDELADILDLPPGEELKESQENTLDTLLERKEKVAKGITRVEGDSAKREAGAIISLGPDSGAPILIYRMRLLREA
jgi:hypothetical protein